MGANMKLLFIISYIIILVSCNNLDKTFENTENIIQDIENILTEKCKSRAKVRISGNTNNLNKIGSIKELGVEFIDYKEPQCNNNLVKDEVNKYLTNNLIGQKDVNIKIFPFIKLKRR